MIIIGPTPFTREERKASYYGRPLPSPYGAPQTEEGEGARRAQIEREAKPQDRDPRAPKLPSSPPRPSVEEVAEEEKSQPTSPGRLFTIFTTKEGRILGLYDDDKGELLDAHVHVISPEEVKQLEAAPQPEAAVLALPSTAALFSERGMRGLGRFRGRGGFRPAPLVGGGGGRYYRGYRHRPSFYGGGYRRGFYVYPGLAWGLGFVPYLFWFPSWLLMNEALMTMWYPGYPREVVYAQVPPVQLQHPERGCGEDSSGGQDQAPAW